MLDDGSTTPNQALEALVKDGHTLGVCTLAPAVVEQVLTGKTTLWPLTHDPALFELDDDFDRLVRTLPHDGRGSPPPDDARLAASLPWETADGVPFRRLRSQVVELKLLPEKR